MKKFTAILLAVVMLFALSASAFAATNSLETDYSHIHLIVQQQMTTL